MKTIRSPCENHMETIANTYNHWQVPREIKKAKENHTKLYEIHKTCTNRIKKTLKHHTETMRTQHEND